MIEISIIIPVKDPDEGFEKTVKMVYAQKCQQEFEVIIINSGAENSVVEAVKRYPIRYFVIDPSEFGHAKTRNWGARLAKGQYLVFMTQDGIPAADDWLEGLVSGLKGAHVAGVYGRQLPKENATPMERYFLGAIYSNKGAVKCLSDGLGLDIRKIFFSNVNSALKKEILMKHPFYEHLIMSEDQEWAKRMLLAGYSILYEPQAAVYHSHVYSLRSVFKRYFDSGVSLSQFAGKEYAMDKFTSAGLKYVMLEMQYLLKHDYAPWIPYAALYDICKFMGVFLGKHEKFIPVSFKKRFSSNYYYWQQIETYHQHVAPDDL